MPRREYTRNKLGKYYGHVTNGPRLSAAYFENVAQEIPKKKNEEKKWLETISMRRLLS